MRINSVSNYTYTYSNNKNKNVKNNFKADVRIEPTIFSDKELPEEHLTAIKEIIEVIPEKFKNVGSDNILVILEPYTNGETKKKKIRTDIKVKAMFKDVEKAKTELLEYTKKESIDNPFVKKLQKPDADIKKLLGRMYVVPSVYTLEDCIYKKYYIPTLQRVEQCVDSAIKSLQKYGCWKGHYEPITILRSKPDDNSMPFPSWF